jgi:sterol desaturase/sphingolipid hydroxylase (fatty acid hydroxylase superfamily)
VVATLIAMDLCNWLAHVADHRFGALWRIHALHHSQEELSVLTSFRAHPLMHTTGFVLATVPVLALTGAHPLAPILITVYVCLGTLPHANVRWSYGPLGRVVVSPAYHRLHHALEGRQEINLGVVLTAWDVLAGRARFPAPGRPSCATGLAGRPVPVEQQERTGPSAWLLLRQLAQPFRAG